ncbi:hypothetical protein RI367_002331 [Sorochytrium milnesiophthora]
MAYPNVAYRCACQRSSEGIFSLYFCESCSEPRCSRCVAYEVACYYCPLCLFEVPSASVKAERNRCARNCFECPVCRNNLQVFGSSGGGSGSSNEPDAPSTTHYLACSFCRWDSRNMDLTFERASGLGGVMLKREESSAYAQEFQKLKTYLEECVRSNNKQSTSATRLASHFSSLTLSTSLSLHSRFGLARAGELNKPQEPYAPVASVSLESQLAADEQQVEALRTMANAEDGYAQQPKMSNKLLPLRTHLRAKLSKRCRTCDSILIKPEPKAQQVKFKIKRTALAFIPNVTIMQPMPWLQRWATTKIALRFTNPLEQDIFVELSTSYPNTSLLCTQFSVAGFDELQQYDANAVRPGSPTMMQGVVQVRANSTAVEVHFVATDRPGTPVKIPLQMVFSYNSRREPGAADQRVAVMFDVTLGVVQQPLE